MSDTKNEVVMSSARAIRIRNSLSGGQMEALNDTLKAQLAMLDHDELEVLNSIKQKLNSGLDEKLRRAADTVGGFVW